MSGHLIRSMSGQITARIREKIVNGAYPPGSPLLQDVIAAEFGVSKIPVREALVQLRAEGLVDVFAHRGFQVRPLSAVEVDEVFRLRLQIEPVRPESANDYAVSLYSELEPSRPISQSLTVAPMSWA